MNYSLYHKLLNINGASSRERTIRSTKSDILNDIKDNPSYKSVLVNELRNQYISVTSTKSDNKKNFVSLPDEFLNIGDSIQWNNMHWFVTSVDFDDDITRRGTIQQCNRTIKWQNPDNKKIIERWCFCNNPYSSDITENNVLTTLSGKYEVQIPYDNETKIIDVGKRIMLDVIGKQPKIYKIDFVDANTNKFSDSDGGFITWTLGSDEYNPNTDNIELMICDYIESDSPTPPTDVKHSYIKGRNEIKTGYTRKYEAVFYDEQGEVVSGVSPLWSYILPIGYESYFNIVQNGNFIEIECSDDENLIGQVITLVLSDENNIYSTHELKVTVVSAFG